MLRGKANEAGRQAHARMIVSGFKPTVIDSTCLLQMYIKCSRLECAAKVFDRMPQMNCVSWNTMMFGYSVNGKMGSARSLFDLPESERDVISWTSLISGYVQNGSSLKAVEVVVMMGRDAVAYDAAALSLVLKAFASLEDYALGLQMHGAVVKLGFGFNVVTVNAVMNMYANCMMFNESLQVYAGMLRSVIEPDGFTYSTVLKACAGGEAMQHGREIHGRVIKCGMRLNSFVSRTIIDMYCKCGLLAEAEKFHERMKEQTPFSWNDLISGYSSNGQSEKALKYCSKMLEMVTKRDDVIHIAVLGTCSKLGDVGLGEQIHAQIIKQSMQSNVRIMNTLVDMYCKCEMVEEAEKVNERMDEQTVVSWNAMNSRFLSTEGIIAAHKCFSRMLERGIRSDNFVFATVLVPT